MDKDARLVEPAGAQANDKLLAEDIGHLRAHGAGDNPGRDHRQGEGRQQHELQVRPVPLPAHLAYRPAAGGRQQRELDAAEDHQQHPQPVVRHADAKHRQYRGQTVNDAVAKIAGDKAEQAAEDKTDRRRQQRQAQRVSHRGHHFVYHRAAGGDRHTKVAVQRPPQPVDKLQGQRLIKAVSLH